MFLPGLLLGVISCWHKNILKTIVAHPSVVLMPAFTHFTFERSTKGSKQEGEEEEPFIKFSPKFTIVNIVLSIPGNVVYGISMTHLAGWDKFNHIGVPEYMGFYLYFISIPLLGLLLTLSSLLFISNSSRIHSALKYTLANLIFSTAAYQVFFVSLVLRDSSHIAWEQHIYFLAVPIFGLLVTILKIILAHYCNINLPACFSLPRVEYGALVCSDPQVSHRLLYFSVLGMIGQLN